MRRAPKARSHGTQSPMKVPKARLYGTYPTLHDRADTSASLLYKDEKLSVCLSTVFFSTQIAAWFLHGLLPDFLKIKHPSLENMKFVFKRF